MSLEKHPNERATYSVDFVDELGAGESLTGTPTVVVFASSASGWTDVTTQFRGGESAPAIIGTTVEFTLKARASVTDQVDGAYVIEVRVTTNQGNTLVANNPDSSLPALVVRTA